ncbi:unnamed protein product [Trypanosoma congolense IL3000]|uniref:WGS project CAEQ00000000 data, annotated contig 2059 n=1 Tax=Trypanosoma congolense (strain IL3000) TaxID=1068625 RepID=F9WB46_TRYCI|nr:unnamed protein product [Trypanosoma congolense IL3000]
MHAVWENSEGVESAYPTRWLTQLLLDGFVSRRVAAHVGLSADHMVETVAAARQLKVPLTPREVSPYYFANNLLSSWGIFGDIKLDDAESVRGSVSHIIQLAHAASTIPIRRSVWLNGAAICNGRGDAVVILGPKMSGKTTLALHCLSEDAAHLRLIGLENFHLAAESSVLSGEDSPTGYQRALLSGVPTSATVGVGALMGSLRPNPSLVRAAHNFDCSSATIQCLMRNSEEVIWFMDRKHSVNINEAFGPHHWCPTWFGRLRGIILLNWDIQELSRPTSSASMRLNHWSERADCVKVLRAFAQSKRSALLKGHYLVRSIYDELRAQSQLEEVLFFGNDVPPVFELRGAVHFDAAVNLICHRLLKQVNS